MCSEIDARTRENPQAAMLSQPQQFEPIGQSANLSAYVAGNPKADERSQFDSAAHRAFMRSLG